MAHKIANMINRVPENTIEVKKKLAAEVGVHIDTVHRWYNNPDVRIDSETIIKVLSFFQKYYPDMTIDSLFEENSIITDSGLA